jgi:hypothetical protein
MSTIFPARRAQSLALHGRVRSGRSEAANCPTLLEKKRGNKPARSLEISKSYRSLVSWFKRGL